MPWRDALFARRRAGMVFGLSRLRSLHAALSPTSRPGAGVPLVHVVGTNGKGSTVAALEHGLLRSGARTLAFTSPHLHRIGERIRLDGLAVEDARLGEWILRVLRAEERTGIRASFFELVTLAACLGIDEQGPDVVIFEAGLGGRLDSTRVLPPVLTLVSRIGLDHREILGRTHASIAAEKAGAFRAGVGVWTSPQRLDVTRVLEMMAAHRGTTLARAPVLPDLPEGLLGSHQRENAGLAFAGLRHFFPGAKASALDGIRVPGRFERVQVGKGSVVFDVAHDLDSTRALVETWRSEFGRAPAAVVFGALADKRPHELSEELRALGPLWWAPPEDAGVQPPPSVATQQFTAPDDPVLFGSLDQVLREGGALLVCGSYRVVGPIRAHVLELGARAIDPKPLTDPRAAGAPRA